PLEETLLSLPDRVVGAATLDQVPADLKPLLDAAALTKLKDVHSPSLRPSYTKWVKGYVAALDRLDATRQVPALVILSDENRKSEVEGNNDITLVTTDAAGVVHTGRIHAEEALSPRMRPELEQRLAKLADENFELALQPKIVALTMQQLRPTHTYDEGLTAEAQNRAA